MAFNPLLIGAAAIGVTLVYASVLDLRSRRVPFRTCTDACNWSAVHTLVLRLPFRIEPVQRRHPPRSLGDLRSRLPPLRPTRVDRRRRCLGARLHNPASADVSVHSPPRRYGARLLFAPRSSFTPALRPYSSRSRFSSGTSAGASRVPLSRNSGDPVTATEISDGRAFGFPDGGSRRGGGGAPAPLPLTLGESIGAMLRDTRLYTRELPGRTERFTVEPP